MKTEVIYSLETGRVVSATFPAEESTSLEVGLGSVLVDGRLEGIDNLVFYDGEIRAEENYDKPTKPTRRQEYTKLEMSGEAQEAIWEALEHLAGQGFNLGPKFVAVSARRARIKLNAKQ